MSRTALVLMVSALAGPPWSAAEPGDPPSSLRPRKPPARLRVSHEHRRTLACVTRRSAGKTACEARTEPAISATAIVFQPVNARGDLIEGDDRTPATVEFERERGMQEESLDLAPGAWATRWPDRTTRFAVGPGERLAIRFTTTTGACVLADDDCQHKPSARKRTVDLPASNRLSE